MSVTNNSSYFCSSSERKDRGISPCGRVSLPFTCTVQDIFEVVVSVTPAGCHRHEPRQEAACAHPLGERQAVEEDLSPPTSLHPHLKLVMLPRAAPCSYSHPSGALGLQPGHRSGLLSLSLLFVFLFQSQVHLPLLISPLDHSTREPGMAFDTSKGLQISGVDLPPPRANLSLGQHIFEEKQRCLCCNLLPTSQQQGSAAETTTSGRSALQTVTTGPASPLGCGDRSHSYGFGLVFPA